MSIQTIERLLANPFGVGRWMFSVRCSRETMTEDVTADEVRRLLKLESAMLRFVRITFVTQRQIAPGGLLPRSQPDGPPAPRFTLW